MIKNELKTKPKISHGEEVIVNVFSFLDSGEMKWNKSIFYVCALQLE